LLGYQQRKKEREHARYYLMGKEETMADIEKDEIA